MRPLGVVLGILIGISALWGTIWLGRYSPLAEKHTRTKMAWEGGTAEAQREIAKQEEQAAKNAKEDQKEFKKLAAKRPPIADKPPYPKARTGERVYEFGSMSIEKRRSIPSTSRIEARPPADRQGPHKLQMYDQQHLAEHRRSGRVGRHRNELDAP